MSGYVRTGPQVAYFEEREPQRLIFFGFFPGIDRWRYIFSLIKVLDRLVNLTVLDNCEIQI